MNDTELRAIIEVSDTLKEIARVLNALPCLRCDAVKEAEEVLNKKEE